MAKQHKRSGWRRGAEVAFLLLVLYPLSMGPAAWMTWKTDPELNGWMTKILEAVYSPVYHVTKITGTGELRNRYMSLFTTEKPTTDDHAIP